MSQIDTTKYYVFYDGDCGLCNQSVKWILENDRKNQFLFASLQSQFGQNFLRDRNLRTDRFNTLYLWKPNSFYLEKSQAVFAIGRILGGVNRVFGNLNFLPKIFNDMVYNQVASNRTKLAAQQCFVPTEEQRKKFVG